MQSPASDESPYDPFKDDEGSEESDDEEGEEEGAEEAPQLLDSRQRPPKEEPEVDADGFITVKGKGKAHR